MYFQLNSDSFGIGSSSIPRLMTYNLNNKLVDKDLMEEYTDLLGIPETNVCHIGTGEQVKSPENSMYLYSNYKIKIKFSTYFLKKKKEKNR